jgi:hypothetical protein
MSAITSASWYLLVTFFRAQIKSFGVGVTPHPYHGKREIKPSSLHMYNVWLDRDDGWRTSEVGFQFFAPEGTEDPDDPIGEVKFVNILTLPQAITL